MKRSPSDSKIVTFQEMERRRQHKKEAARKPSPRRLFDEFSMLIVWLKPRPGEDPQQVEVANLPFREGGLETFRALAAHDPDGFFRAYDSSIVKFRDVLAISNPCDPEDRELILPERGPGRRAEIEVRLKDSGQTVNLWNLPDDELGRQLYEQLAEVHPDCDVLTSDFGYMPLRLTSRRP